MSEKYTSLEHTIRSVVTAPKQVNEYLQYAIPAAKTIFKMKMPPTTNLPAAATTKAVPSAVKTTPTVPVTAIPVPAVAPSAAIAPPAVATASSTSPLAAALPAAIAGAAGATMLATAPKTQTQTATVPQTQTQTATVPPTPTPTKSAPATPEKNNTSSGKFDSEARTAGNSRTLTTSKSKPKSRRKAVGESVNTVLKVIEEAAKKKKEKEGGKNPFIDLEPKLKDQELDQGK